MKFFCARMTLLAFLMALGLGLASCGPVTPIKPPPGYIYEDISAPLSYDFHQTAVTSSKTGQATTGYVFIPFVDLNFSWDRCDTAMAARNGGITKINYADYRYLNVLGIFQQFTVTVHGE